MKNILVIEDNFGYLVEDAQKELESEDLKIHLAKDLQEGLEKLKDYSYDYVVTDMDFPPEKEWEIDFKKVLVKYAEFLSRINKEINPKRLAELLMVLMKNNKEEKFRGEFYYPIGPILSIHYDEIRQSLQKGQKFKGMYSINGIEIAEECRKKEIPYSFYTLDWAHSWPGPVKIIEGELTNSNETIAALMCDFGRYNDSFSMADLGLFGVRLIKEDNEYGRIIATHDYKFIIGRSRCGKDYTAVLKTIVDLL